MRVQRYEKNREQRLKNGDFLSLMPIASLEYCFSSETLMDRFAGERGRNFYRTATKIFTIFCVLKCGILR